jgi:sugar diacid utilization regulator
MKESGHLRMRIALGNFFTGPGSIARSYRAGFSTTISVSETMAIRLSRSGVISNVCSCCNSDIALHMLAQDSRLREELVLNLIRSDTLSPQLTEWAQHSVSCGDRVSLRIRFSTSSSRRRLSCASICSSRACSSNMLAQDSRLREELVLNLIRSDTLSPQLTEWAQRLISAVIQTSSP